MLYFLFLIIGVLLGFAICFLIYANSKEPRRFFYREAEGIPMIGFSEDLHPEDIDAIKDFLIAGRKKESSSPETHTTISERGMKTETMNHFFVSLSFNSDKHLGNLYLTEEAEKFMATGRYILAPGIIQGKNPRKNQLVELSIIPGKMWKDPSEKSKK
jgi:hypothetical protein